MLYFKKINLKKHIFKKWNDTQLHWEPKHFNGTHEIVLPQKLVWVPPLFIYNR